MSDTPESEASEGTTSPTPAAEPQHYRILGSDGSERSVFGELAHVKARAEALASFVEGVVFRIVDPTGSEV